MPSRLQTSRCLVKVSFRTPALTARLIIVARSPGAESRQREEEGSHGNSQGGETRRVAQGTEEAPGEGEGVHPDARPAEPGAARSALGARREAIHLRERARDADAQRRLRGARPAGHLSRDVQS